VSFITCTTKSTQTFLLQAKSAVLLFSRFTFYFVISVRYFRKFIFYYNYNISQKGAANNENKG